MEQYINSLNNVWHLKVPKIFHVYWGTGIFSYLRFMTIRSFMLKNPEWKIMFWYPKYPSKTIVTWNTKEQEEKFLCDDYTKELKNLPIEMIPIDFNDYGFSNDVSEVHKSDFIRLEILSTIGGVWSDMDILYFRPINCLTVNIENNKNIETFVCISSHGHSIGFLMSAGNNSFYKILIEQAKKVYNKEMYQTIGSLLWNKNYRTLQLINKISSVADIGDDAVYSMGAANKTDIYNGAKPKITTNTIGIHWYGGCALSGKFLQETNGGLMNLPNNVLGNLLKNKNINP
jgi:hypothetical protein